MTDKPMFLPPNCPVCASTDLFAVDSCEGSALYVCNACRAMWDQDDHSDEVKIRTYKYEDPSDEVTP